MINKKNDKSEIEIKKFSIKINNGDEILFNFGRRYNSVGINGHANKRVKSFKKLDKEYSKIDYKGILIEIKNDGIYIKEKGKKIRKLSVTDRMLNKYK